MNQSLYIEPRIRNLSSAVKYVKNNNLLRAYFENQNLQINTQNVKTLLETLAYAQKVLVVEGCSTQCSFCDNDPPKKINPSPFVNFSSIIDTLDDLVNKGFIEMAYPAAMIAFHKNGETLHWSDGKHNAYDLLKKVHEKNPWYREDSEYNNFKLFTAGTMGNKKALRALEQIVADPSVLGDDPNGHPGQIRFSFHTGSLLYRQDTGRWERAMAEDYRIARPLMDENRVRWSIHYFFEGNPPEDKEELKWFYLQPQIDELARILKMADYSEKEIKEIIESASPIDNPFDHKLYVQTARVVPSMKDKLSRDIFEELQRATFDYSGYIESRGEDRLPEGYYPPYQTSLVARTGSVIVNPSKYRRTELETPLQGSQFFGTLGIPVSPKTGQPCYFRSLCIGENSV
ncbi:MAG: hypothetical protein KKF44_11500 [Nanoarchaeota archaeon]|nr:hypothetical protein [Nanoarchaeota archaeon]